jgi:HK97 family phage major capsid protein
MRSLLATPPAERLEWLQQFEGFPTPEMDPEIPISGTPDGPAATLADDSREHSARPSLRSHIRAARHPQRHRVKGTPMPSNFVSRADQIRTRQAAIRTDLDSLEELEDPTDDDHVRTDALLQEWDDLTVELAPLADREAEHRRSSRRAGCRQHREATTPQTPDLVVRQNLDPFYDLESVRTGTVPAADVRARAVTAVEKFSERHDAGASRTEGAKNATRMIEKSGAQFGTAVARQMLTTGAPEYLAAFQSYINDPTAVGQRAALSLTSANGGYLVPFTLDPTIILTNAGSANPYRQVATVKTTTTNDWNGVTSAGVSAEWTAEGVEAADASPTVGQLEDHPAEGRRLPVRFV